MHVSLVVVHGKPQGKSLGFGCGEFVFGRGNECHIRPNSFWVSRQHCILRVTESDVQLHDLGSTNGTLVNGKRLVGAQKLSHGDQIQIGPLVFQVCVASSPSDTRNLALETSETSILDAGQDATASSATLPKRHADN